MIFTGENSNPSFASFEARIGGSLLRRGWDACSSQLLTATRNIVLLRITAQSNPQSAAWLTLESSYLSLLLLHFESQII